MHSYGPDGFYLPLSIAPFPFSLPLFPLIQSVIDEPPAPACGRRRDMGTCGGVRLHPGRRLVRTRSVATVGLHPSIRHGVDSDPRTRGGVDQADWRPHPDHHTTGA